MNNVCLLGRLTDDPEVRISPGGVSVLSFRIAVDRPRTKDGEQQADFISCVAWRQQAEFIGKYFSKGKMIAITGAIRTRSYADSRYPNVTHYVAEVYVDRVDFAGDRVQSNGNGNQSVPSYSNKRTSTAPKNAAQSSPVQSLGALDDFEDILSDYGVPF